MRISEVNIDLIKPKDGLIAFASLIVDEEIYLGNIGVMKRLMSDSYRLVYPTRKMGNKNFNIYYPINKETGKKIEKEVINKLEEVLKNNDRHYNSIHTSNTDGYR